MPRRKSQPAKYYQCANEAQNDEIISSETYHVLPTSPSPEHAGSSILCDAVVGSPSAPCCECPTSTFESPNESNSEVGLSEDRVGLEAMETNKPSPKRRRMMSPKKECSFNDDVDSNGQSRELTSESMSTNDCGENVDPTQRLQEEQLSESQDGHQSENLGESQGGNLSEQQNEGQSGNQGENQIEQPPENEGENLDSNQNASRQENNRNASSANPPKTGLDIIKAIIEITTRLSPPPVIRDVYRNESLVDTDDISGLSGIVSLEHSPEDKVSSPGSSSGNFVNGLNLAGSDDTNENVGSQSPSSSNGRSGCENEVASKMERGSFSSPKKEKCSLCEKYLMPSSMREHMDRHNNTGKYRCEFCDKPFTKVSSLRKHKVMHTNERRFACGECPRAYKQKAHLCEHRRSHTGDRPYVCTVCSLALISKSLLNRHMKVHEPRAESGGPPSANLENAEEASKEKCSAELPKNEALILAKKPESASDKFVCSVCEGSFETKKLLSSHFDLVHKSENAHKCNQCTDIFPTARSLKAHMHSIHKNTQQHACPDCEKSFAHNSSLTKHRVREHNHRSSSLVQMGSTNRKRVFSGSTSSEESSLLKMGNGSKHTNFHDGAAVKPSEVPPLALVNGNEGNKFNASLTQYNIQERITPKLEIKGSDM